MNPAHIDELVPFMRNLNSEMPIHTDSTAKIKRSYSQGMPKNMMEYSAHVNNKFLNDNLAIIEEIAHRDQKNPIPKWFRDYQIKHYAKFGILKGDNFFPRDRFFAKIHPNAIYHHASMSFHNPGFTSVIGNTKVFGSTIEVGGTSANIDNQNTISCARVPGGVVGTYYNQLAVNIHTASGNYRLGLYDDSSGTPVNLYAETGSIAAATGFNFQSITEIPLSTSQNFIAVNCDNATLKVYRNLEASGDNIFKTWTYGAMQNPISGTSSGSGRQNTKMGHS